MTERVDLDAVGTELLLQARQTEHGRASTTVLHGDGQRAVLMAFVPGTDLGEHDAPPSATLHVLRGAARLRSGDQSWDLTTGELIAIPQARHSVEVDDVETLLLLTVSLG